jgi:isoleucyl-tRNA synthetase
VRRFKGDKQIPFKVLAENIRALGLKQYRYHQLMPYVQPEGKAFEVIIGDFVTTARWNRAVPYKLLFWCDFRVCKQNNISSIMVMDEYGKPHHPGG